MKKLLLSVFALSAYLTVNAQCSDIFISEYVEGSGNNKALGIFNPTIYPINLNNQYRLVRYNNGTSAAAGEANAQAMISLGNHVIAPGDEWVIVIDQRNASGTGQNAPADVALQAVADTFLCPDYNLSYSMYFNGNDAVSIQKTLDGGTTWNYVDIFGMMGDAAMVTGVSWSDQFPYDGSVGTWWTKDHTLIRKANVQHGVTSNPSPEFIVTAEWDSLPKNTFTQLGTHTFIPDPAPAAPTAVASISYCLGTTASALSATALSCNVLNWYITATGGTASSIAIIPSTATTGTTNYYVSQTNAITGESPRTSIVVTVNPLPATPTVSANGPTSFCTGGSVLLTSSATTGNVWSTTATTQSISVTASGTFTVMTTDTNGCTSATSSAILVNVSNAPVPTIAVLGGTTICQGQSTQLTSSIGDTYLWSPGGGTTQTILVTTAGNYNVTTTNAVACNGVGTSSNTVITVSPVPTAAGSVASVNGYAVTFGNTSTGATTYIWDFGDATASSTITAPTHSYSTNGVYTITLIASNGNCNDTTTISVTLSVGIATYQNNTSINVFPNPAKEYAIIDISNDVVVKTNITIYDITGRIIKNIYNSEMNAGKTSLKVETAEMPAGMYYIGCTFGNVKKTLRMVVIK